MLGYVVRHWPGFLDGVTQHIGRDAEPGTPVADLMSCSMLIRCLSAAPTFVVSSAIGLSVMRMPKKRPRQAHVALDGRGNAAVTSLLRKFHIHVVRPGIEWELGIHVLMSIAHCALAHVASMGGSVASN